MFSAFTDQTQKQPDEAAALGLLQHLDKQELQALLDDENKLIGLINDLSQLKSLQDDKEACLATNKSLAEYNLSRQPHLAEHKATLATTYTNARRLYDDFQVKSKKLDEVGGGQLSVDTALVLLKTESAKSEEQAEETANGFLDGNKEVEEFLDTFIKQSTKSHAQKIKTEKLQAIATRVRQGLPPQAQSSQQTVPSQPKHNFYNAGANQWGSAAYGNPQPYFRS